MLDPSQLKIAINPYLTHNGATKEFVILNMIKSFKTNHISQAGATENALLSSSSSTNTISATALSPSLLKHQLSIEHSNESVQNVKKVRENLIQKHTPVHASSADPIVDEIEKYLKSNVNCDDVLKFWRLADDECPHLKSLARIVLAIPASSTPSEQVFSTTGLIFNAKRTMLLPENIGKIQVIHDNCNFLKKKRNDFVFVCTFVLYIFLVITILIAILFLPYHDRYFVCVCCKY